MKLKLVFISIFLVVFIYSCRENNKVVNVNDPSIGGNYTIIKGNISGTLAVEKSPFFVKENIYVNNGEALTIDPGVTLFFDEKTNLIVEGTIAVMGTKQRPVFFTAYNKTWLGIAVINANDTSKFKFCTIQYVYQETDDTLQGGAVEINNSNVIIENSVLKANSSVYGGGLSLINSNGIFKNNIIRQNESDVYGGAMLLQNSTAVLINNTIYSNSCFNFGGGIAILDPVTIELQNNIFYKNFSYAGTGDPNISMAAGDSSYVYQNYNYLATGMMNPMFKSSEDLHLSLQSPCIDNGNPDSLYNDYDRTQNDQGAFGGPGGNW